MLADLREVVVDASVVAKLYSPTPERNLERAELLLDAWDAGSLRLCAPSLITLELLNVAARKWRLRESALHVLARAIGDLVGELLEPDVERVVHWSARGLSAYDAAYVAVAEGRGIRLITDDGQVAEAAPGIAIPLASVSLSA